MLKKQLLKLFIMLNSFSADMIRHLATSLNGGLSPKHRLMDYHQFFIDNINTNDVVLDIGCGNGFVSYDISKKAKTVIGVDMNKKNIGKAKVDFANNNISYINADATTYDFREKFDVIVLSNVLEHIEDRISFLEKIKKLAPKILIRVPMIDRDWLTLYKKELGMEWRLDSTHFTEYTIESFTNEMTAARLEITDCTIKFGEIWAVVINKQLL